MSTVKILLVDDDEDDFVLTKDILRESPNSHQYELTWCSNFSEAINAMLKSYYDIYLVDYRLGKESGIDLLNEAIKSNCTEPIIIITGKGDLKIDQEAMKLGASDYLIKESLNSHTLERAIRYSIEHAKTLKQLKISEAKFRIIFERSKDPMLITSPEGQILEANHAAINFFESSYTDIIKTNLPSLYKTEESRKRYTGAMISAGFITDLETELVTLGGTTKFCSISSFLQVSQHANEELYYSVIHDLTFRLNQEKHLALMEKLGAAERIAKKLSIEIHNPLSNINLAVDELSNSIDSQDNLILTDIIKSNCEKINALTTELIGSTELSSLHLSEVDLSVLISDLLEDASLEYGLNINNPLTESLIIRADPAKLKLALGNILLNAVEATSNEPRAIELSAERMEQAIKLNIKDSGSGIESENINKIFEPFFTTKNKAAGLGLTRAQRIIEAHKGLIQVSSEVNIGTAITIFLQLPI